MAFITGSYYLISWLEKKYKAYCLRNKPHLNSETIQHQFFAISTFITFNIYFIFAGRPIIKLMPAIVEWLFQGLIIFLSTLMVISHLETIV